MKNVEEKIREQFIECEDDPGFWRCRGCQSKYSYGDVAKSDLLLHLDNCDDFEKGDE
ncbi:hypothetical protein SAMN05443636_2329 [Halobaculum gomorrense]|uniref:Uncharacterized protein n=1 Tax=Halobaculum gomorrense TaxID=43928 RepID=A0A1M5S444_9EURY|nr:hypothetical protein SAMN05443636_2329 [Halobaculum gomorrense]